VTELRKPAGLRPGVTLRDITLEDMPLYEALVTDRTVMAELGGPLPREGVEPKVRSLVEDVQAGRIWYFTVVPDDVGEPVGTICVWAHDFRGEQINEIGWMLLPAYQGRGLASEALRQTLERARSERRWDVIHAFPGVTNGPSNGLCRKFGFSKLGEFAVEYQGRPLRVNHWVIDLGLA
jgi:RimJ/RimL family protein N-acetyltransferase